MWHETEMEQKSDRERGGDVVAERERERVGGGGGRERERGEREGEREREREKLHFPRPNSNLKNKICHAKSQRLHFLSVLTDRMHWPSATLRVAPLYRMCRSVAYLCVAFPCHIAKSEWKVWILKGFFCTNPVRQQPCFLSPGSSLRWPCPSCHVRCGCAWRWWGFATTPPTTRPRGQTPILSRRLLCPSAPPPSSCTVRGGEGLDFVVVVGVLPL